jgi:hypothetical protein
MKKIIAFLTLILSFTLTGCSKPFYMEDDLYKGNIDNVFIVLDTYEEYEALIDSKKSFALYVYEESCAGCIAFTPVLTKYLLDNNLVFYKINVGIAKSQEGIIKDTMEGTPAVFLFNEGEYVTFLDSHSSKKVEKNAFKTPEGFGEWFTKYVNLK